MSFKTFERVIVECISTVCYLGYIPLMPGTVASIATTLFYATHPQHFPSGLLAGIATVLGLAASHRYTQLLSKKDAPIIVIDEVAGMLLALWIAAPLSWGILIVLGLFRAFDIFKPWPIKLLEKFPGGLGIMADDIAAGLCAGGLYTLGYMAAERFALHVVWQHTPFAQLPLVSKLF